MEPISSYGVFVSNSIPYLHQEKTGSGRDCLGLNLVSPFKIEPVLRIEPPHNISLDIIDMNKHYHNINQFIDNKLVDLFMPKPNINTPPKVVFIKDKSLLPFSVLRKLSELSSMSASATVVYEKEKEDNYRSQLKVTNLGPLSLIGVSVPESLPIYGLSEFARLHFRHLVICGHPEIPIPAGALDYTTSYKAAAQMLKEIQFAGDFKLIGSNFFRNFMVNFHNKLQG